MIEWFILPGVVIVSALIPKKKQTDKDKIQKIMKRMGLSVKDGERTDYPKLLNESQNDIYCSYIYSLPWGLSSEKVIEAVPTIGEGINKDLEYEFENGVFKLFAYNQSLPNNWKYTTDLIQPGKWLVPIGRNHKGILYHDFDKYAHFLIGGVPGFGKTILTKVMFLTLLMNNPKDVEFYILDLKGGLEYSKYLGLPQVKAVASDIYEATETLIRVVEDMKAMEKIFKENGYTNITETTIKKRTFIFVDEGAELSPGIVTPDKKKLAQYCQASLSEIARIGRAVGFRLVYSTQYPSSRSIDMSIKQNIVSRVSFVVPSNVASQVILDDTGAEKLPSIPGRAIYSIDKKRIIQVPYISDKQIFEILEANKDEIQSAGTDRTIVDDDRPNGSNNDKTVTRNSWGRIEKL